MYAASIMHLVGFQFSKHFFPSIVQALLNKVSIYTCRGAKIPFTYNERQKNVIISRGLNILHSKWLLTNLDLNQNQLADEDTAQHPSMKSVRVIKSLPLKNHVTQVSRYNQLLTGWGLFFILWPFPFSPGRDITATWMVLLPHLGTALYTILQFFWEERKERRKFRKNQKKSRIVI